MITKIPPHSVEAEQAVLGTAMLAGEVLDEITISPDDFYREGHKVIFSAMRELRGAERNVDLITLTDALKTSGKLDSVGGPVYIATLTDIVPSVANIEHYAKVVRDHATRRKAITAATQIADLAYSGADVDDLSGTAQGAFLDMGAVGGGSVSFMQIMADGMKTIEKRYEHKSTVTGLPTGFIDIDRKLAGLHPADLIILAGRPSMGKTALAMNIVLNVSEKKPAGVFSLEMSKSQLGDRSLAMESGVNSQSIRTGYLTESDWANLSRAYGKLSGAPIHVDDTPALTISELRTRARRMSKKHGIGLVVIDYLQLVRSPKSASREQEIADISRQLKAMAKELNIPVLALAQLNRSLENRPDKHPILSDLRDSGQIEQDADVIMFIYRDEVYNKAPDNPKKGTADVDIAKQRNGPTGRCEMWFRGETTTFQDKA